MSPYSVVGFHGLQQNHMILGDGWVGLSQLI